MKAKFKGKIYRIDRDAATTTLYIESEGKVDSRVISAQEATFGGKLIVKNLIADQLKVGGNYSITISDDEENDGLT